MVSHCGPWRWTGKVDSTRERGSRPTRHPALSIRERDKEGRKNPAGQIGGGGGGAANDACTTEERDFRLYIYKLDVSITIQLHSFCSFPFQMKITDDGLISIRSPRIADRRSRITCHLNKMVLNECLRVQVVDRTLITHLCQNLTLRNAWVSPSRKRSYFHKRKTIVELGKKDDHRLIYLAHDSVHLVSRLSS